MIPDDDRINMQDKKSGGKDDGNDAGTVTLTRTKTQKPAMYKVLLLNDDYTPMEFVVEVLCRFFNMDGEKANQVMLTVHYQGKAVCGVYTAEIAETKVMQVNQYAQKHQHPLLCSYEQA